MLKGTAAGGNALCVWERLERMVEETPLVLSIEIGHIPHRVKTSFSKLS